MKKTNKLLSILVAGTMAISFVGALGCGNNNVDSGNNGGNDGGTTAKKVSFQDACDSSIIGGLGLLNSAPTATTVVSYKGMALASFTSAEEKPEAKLEKKEDVKREDVTSKLTDAQKDSILKNLAIAQNTINGGISKTEVKPSDREGYQHYYKISAADMAGNPQFYEFYLNGDVETEEVDEEDGEVEKSMALDGIVILDNVEYDVTGKREVEIEGEETEEELEFKVSLDANNYVVISQEIESGENEFTYSSYKDGSLVYESEVEYETNENGEVELSFSLEQDGKELEYSYEFYENKKGKFVKVEIEDGEKEMEADIKITVSEDGTVLYEFVNHDALEEDKKPEDKNDKTDAENKNADANADNENADNEKAESSDVNKAA